MRYPRKILLSDKMSQTNQFFSLHFLVYTQTYLSNLFIYEYNRAHEPYMTE